MTHVDYEERCSLVLTAVALHSVSAVLVEQSDLCMKKRPAAGEAACHWTSFPVVLRSPQGVGRVVRTELDPLHQSIQSLPATADSSTKSQRRRRTLLQTWVSWVCSVLFCRVRLNSLTSPVCCSGEHPGTYRIQQSFPGCSLAWRENAFHESFSIY